MERQLDEFEAGTLLGGIIRASWRSMPERPLSMSQTRRGGVPRQSRRRASGRTRVSERSCALQRPAQHRLESRAYTTGRQSIGSPCSE